ncbi:MAG TPA: signal recognition particle receptor subunit alpha, partial [Acidimicrobiales bacterium]|nr:signal recognition particle receptor subunit alpha [Acidimicrobiales bacterium]
MFESLTDRFEDIFSRLRKGGRLSEADIDEVMREIRQALLEADVNFRVARQMVARIKEDLAGAELSKALSPEQQIVKRVNAELVNVLGGPGLKIAYASKPPTVV